MPKPTDLNYRNAGREREAAGQEPAPPAPQPEPRPTRRDVRRTGVYGLRPTRLRTPGPHPLSIKATAERKASS